MSKKKIITIVHEEDRVKPRIPKEGQDRIKGGGAHKDDTHYKRNKKHKKQKSDDE